MVVHSHLIITQLVKVQCAGQVCVETIAISHWGQMGNLASTSKSVPVELTWTSREVSKFKYTILMKVSEDSARSQPDSTHLPRAITVHSTVWSTKEASVSSF